MIGRITPKISSENGCDVLTNIADKFQKPKFASHAPFVYTLALE